MLDSKYISSYLTEVKYIAKHVSISEINTFAKIILDTSLSGGRLFFAGVGGSAANCSHAVNDFRKILRIQSYCISDSVSELTARINDDGWETCYSNYLKVSKFSNNDTLVVLSVGGGSETTSANLVAAMKYAKQRGGNVISIVSRDGGAAKEISDACVIIPVLNSSRITPHAEEWQMVILHLVVNYLNEMLVTKSDTILS